MADKIEKSEEDWKIILTPEQYHVCREGGTERPFTGKYNDFKEQGQFNCSCCSNSLFDSDSKFDSGTGWPSFWAPVENANLETETDNTFGMTRTEVTCGKCGSHIGHIFPDGPAPTGLRYCANSASLHLKKGESS